MDALNAKSLQQKNQALALRLVVAALLMFGFAYALSPFYIAFCQWLGIDRANASLTQPGAALRVEFDANVAAGLPVVMKSLDKVQVAHAGGLVRARFWLKNESSNDLLVRAVPSFAPARAAGLLQKLECFCFDAMPLKAGAEQEVTVVLFVAEQLPPEIGAATLSYSLQAITPAAAGAS